jgi:hypothetical protein
MTPKEKAEELIEMCFVFASNEATTEDGFVYSDEIQLWNAQQCALIAVDEVTKYLKEVLIPNPFGQYWKEVRQEIETFNTKEK